MKTVHDPMTKVITLHGLGFIQVVLGGNQRLHVWHPDLPKRACWESSSVHSHRFAFESRILVGEQINVKCAVMDPDPDHYLNATHNLYVHNGARTSLGNRPWDLVKQVSIVECDPESHTAGSVYWEFALDYHKTIPGGDGRVATLMKKTFEGELPAHSSCLIGVAPDVDFDRFQIPPEELWRYVNDVLGGHPVLEVG